MVVTTTITEVDIEKDESIMSREEIIIILRGESGHHRQAGEEETHDTLLPRLIDPRFIIIILALTMFE